MSTASSQSSGSQPAIRQILVWLLAELMLNFVGLDDLADYSEFVFRADATPLLPAIALISR